MDYKMAEDAIKDAITNRRLAKQPDDEGLEKALEIILTPITELPDVQRLIIQLHKSKIEIDKRSEALNLILNENFSGQSTISSYAKQQIEQALKAGE